MRVILNQFNHYFGKYQIPATIDYKTKMMEEWVLHVNFARGNSQFIPVKTVEQMAIIKINLRKIPTIRR